MDPGSRSTGRASRAGRVTGQRPGRRIAGLLAYAETSLEVAVEQVDVSSPDGTVRVVARLDGAVGVQVTGLERHTDASLARQATAAARVALARLTAAERQASGSDVGSSAPSW